MNKSYFDGKQIHIFIRENLPDPSAAPVIKITNMSSEDMMMAIKNPLDLRSEPGVRLRCEKCLEVLEKEITPTLVYITPENCMYVFLYCSMRCKHEDEGKLKEMFKIKIN